MDRKVKIDLKLRNKLTDEDMELVEHQLTELRKDIFDYKIYNVSYDYMKERKYIYNCISPLLKNKEVLNNIMDEFNRLYALYETEKITNEELTFLDVIYENAREFQTNLLRLCSAIYVMTFGFCSGSFDEVSDKIWLDSELLYVGEEYLQGTYVNDENIGRTFVDDVPKVKDYCRDVVKYFTTNF